MSVIGIGIAFGITSTVGVCWERHATDESGLYASNVAYFNCLPHFAPCLHSLPVQPCCSCGSLTSARVASPQAEEAEEWRGRRRFVEVASAGRLECNGVACSKQGPPQSLRAPRGRATGLCSQGCRLDQLRGATHVSHSHRNPFHGQVRQHFPYGQRIAAFNLYRLLLPAASPPGCLFAQVRHQQQWLYRPVRWRLEQRLR